MRAARSSGTTSLLKNSALAFFAITLSGCSLVVGRHPDGSYARAYCFPCIEATQNLGVGLRVTPDENKFWRRMAAFWFYE